MSHMTRREWLRLTMGMAAFALTGAGPTGKAMLKRPIPTTGELLPVIGLGTWQTFDVDRDESERAPLREVLRELVARGGSVVDSSPMYGESETVVGDLTSELGIRDRLFLATKVWTRGEAAGIRQMEGSFRRFRTERIDLMQVHNLMDWRTHLVTLKRWKAQGRFRYIGATHYTESAHDELIAVHKAEKLDFVQVNYSIVEPQAASRLLPFAEDQGLAVVVNRPFAAAGLFRKVRGKRLPSWAAEIGCASWAQFFLKFVVGHPAVTCTIPGTSKVEHLVDNLQAGLPPLPDPAMRRRMVRTIADL